MHKEYNKNLKGFHHRIYNELTILLYHGVTHIKSKGIENHSKKHIDIHEFKQQMKYLRDNCNVISIEDFLIARNNAEDLEPRSVIISFDDGFRNNYTNAAPILEEFSLPAVFYISSGIVNTNLMFWVDIIEDCINITDKSSIKINLNKEVEFRLLNVDDKITALNMIKSFCKNSSIDKKNQIIEELEKHTEVKASVEHSDNYEKINWNELKKMHDSNLFTIGGHSLYHDILSTMENHHLRREIRSSLDLLENNLNTTINHYSYPEGQNNHYGSKTIKILKEFGIKCSPSAIVGLNTYKTDLFNLRRIMVGFMGLPFPFLDDSL